MKNLFFLALVASTLFFSCSTDNFEEQSNPNYSDNLLSTLDEGDSNLDKIIFSYVEFQDGIASLDSQHLQNTIVEINNAISSEDYLKANSLMLNELQIKDSKVGELFGHINYYLQDNSATNIEEKIEVRLRYLICEGLIPSIPQELCNDIETRWWGGDCGLGSYLSAVASGVGAMIAVGSAIGATAGTGGLAGGVAVVGASIAVGNAVNKIGKLAKDCG